MNFREITSLGKVDFLKSGPPTVSELGARVNHVYCDSSTGIRYVCTDATFGAQVWQSCAPSTATIADPAHPDLIAFYTMDSIAGVTLQDDSTNNNYDGTISGATSVAGHIDNCLNFGQASSHKVTFSTLYDNLGSVGSIAFWAYHGGINSGNRVKIFSTDSLYLYMDADSQIGLKGTSWEKYGTGSVYNTWRFYVVQPDESFTDWEVSVDGGAFVNRLVGETFSGGPSNWFGSGTNTFGQFGAVQVDLGTNTALTDNFRLDQVRFFNRRLTTGEITDLYNEGLGVARFSHPNLLSAYTMDDILGGILGDETGRKDGTITGAVAGTGLVGDHLTFNGASDYVDLGTGALVPTTGDFSVNIWVNQSSLGTGVIIEQRIDSDSSSRFRIAAGSSGSITVSNGPSVIISNNNLLVATEYVMVTVVKSSNTIGIYKNASLFTSFTAVSSNTLTSAGALLGAGTTSGSVYNQNLGNWFNGSLDQIRVFDRVLTPTEISELYNGGAGI